MRKPVDYECPLHLQDPLGTCLDFDPSYDVRRLEAGPSAKTVEKLLRLVSEVTETDRDSFSLDTPLVELFGGKKPLISDLEEVLRGMKSRAGVSLELLIARGRIRDLLPVPDSREVYVAKVETCRDLKEDEEAFRAGRCKRRGHILLPHGRESFRALRPSGWREVKDTSLASRGVSPEKRLAEEKRRKSRLYRVGEPFDARTQSVGNRKYLERRAMEGRLPPSMMEEVLFSVDLGKAVASYAQQIVRGVEAYSRGKAQEGNVLIPEDPKDLERAGVPTEAAAELSKALAGAQPGRRVTRPELSEIVRGLLGHPSFRTNRDRLYFLAEAVDLRRVAPELRPFVKEARGYQRTESEKLQAAMAAEQRGGGGAVVLRRQETRNTEVYVSISLLFPSGVPDEDRAVLLPVGEGKWPRAFNVAADENANFSKLRLSLKKAVRPGEKLGGELVLDLQHSKLFGIGALTGRVDYSSLQGLSLPEIAVILARKKLSSRRKRRGRTRELYTFRAQNNPLPTYTLTPADLQGPAYSMGGKDEKGKPRPVGSVVADMGPGTYKPYRDGLMIYWSAKDDSQPKVVSQKRFGTWLTVAKYGEKVSQAAHPEASLSETSISATARNNPMSIYSALSNPRKARKGPSAGQSSWRQQFKALAQQAEFRAAAGEGMRAAWAKVYPVASRKPKHNADIEQHIANNNPNPYVLDIGPYGPSMVPVNRRNPNPYALDMGPYGPSMVPVNRRNPANGVTVGRFPSPCSVCGESMKGQEIHQIGVGPRGGKQMAHVHCG